MSIYYEDASVTLYHGDCIEVMRTLPDNSVDSVVCDPPYGLEFMGKDWDSFKRPANAWGDVEPAKPEGYVGSDGVLRAKTQPMSAQTATPRFTAGAPFQQWCEEWARECLRVLKPGGHLLAFGGTRTWHRLACAVEDAGFEVRDSIAWLYGSGFPKSLDVSKAIDKAAGATHKRDAITARARGDFEAERRALDALALTEREVIGRTARPDGTTRDPSRGGKGGGSALLGSVDGTLNVNGAMADITAPATPDAERWQGWGTALKPAFEPIVVARKPLAGTVAANVLEHGTGALNIDGCRVGGATGLQRPERRGKGDTGGWADYSQEPGQYGTPDGAGRWPANVVLDESQAEALDEMSGERTSGGTPPRRGPDQDRTAYGAFAGQGDVDQSVGANTGGASRFFPTFRYEAKAPQSERPKVNGTAHPTVKPLDLMRWLVRLVTPPGGTVLEPFAGSGTTVEACVIEGFKCIAIEKTDEYLPLTVARIHRRRDPVAAIRLAGDDLGLFDLGET